MNETFTFNLSVVCQALSEDGSLNCPTCGEWMHNAKHVSDHWSKKHFSIIPDGGAFQRKRRVKITYSALRKLEQRVSLLERLMSEGSRGEGRVM